jgi:anti-anti-sigma factor
MAGRRNHGRRSAAGVHDRSRDRAFRASGCKRAKTLPDEIDTSNDGQVQDTLTRALADATAVLVADAGRTTFCGCSGVTALLLTHHRAAAAGAQLRVLVGSPSMRRMLELTAADQALNTYPTLAAALADGQAPDRS